MNKITKKAITITTVLSLGLTTGITEACENGSQIKHIDKTKLVCKNKAKYDLKDCTELSIYIHKAETSHILQDLKYYYSFEVSKKSLVKGAYYEVVYSHDMPVATFIIKPQTKKQKDILNIMNDCIKQQQKDNNYNLANEYKRYKQSFKNSKYSYYSVNY